MNHLGASGYDPRTDCSCPPPWGNDNTPNPTCVDHPDYDETWRP